MGSTSLVQSERAKEIGLKIITTVEISNKQTFTGVHGVPGTQKKLQENWVIWKSKRLKSGFLSERIAFLVSFLQSQNSIDSLVLYISFATFC